MLTVMEGKAAQTEAAAPPVMLFNIALCRGGSKRKTGPVAEVRREMMNFPFK